MGHAVIRVFVVKLSEFLNRWRAGEMRADTAELGGDALCRLPPWEICVFELTISKASFDGGLGAGASREPGLEYFTGTVVILYLYCRVLRETGWAYSKVPSGIMAA
jgi:hypothetical protein